jgi:hypothetical protein
MALSPTEIGTPPLAVPDDFLVGSWVGSFTGLIYNDPRHPRSAAIPQLPAVFDMASTTDPAAVPVLNPANGFFPCAGLLGLGFQRMTSGGVAPLPRLEGPVPDPRPSPNVIIGEMAINSSGRVVSEELSGTYELWGHQRLAIVVGTFSILFTQSGGTRAQVIQNFRFMARSPDELHFLSDGSLKKEPNEDWKTGRPTIAEGVLYRARSA